MNDRKAELVNTLHALNDARRMLHDLAASGGDKDERTLLIDAAKDMDGIIFNAQEAYGSDDWVN